MPLPTIRVWYLIVSSGAMPRFCGGALLLIPLMSSSRSSCLLVCKIFLRGLIVLLPALITVYLLLALAWTLELTFGRPLQAVLPENTYFPGLGILAAVTLVFLFGLLLYSLFVRRLARMAEKVFERMPIVKSVYMALSGLIAYFQRANGQESRQVVLVTLAPNYQLLGFVTRDDVSSVTRNKKKGIIAVYMPMSYQIGGYTVFLPSSVVQPIDMSIEDAMRFILTGGAGSDAKIIDDELAKLEQEINERREIKQFEKTIKQFKNAKETGEQVPPLTLAGTSVSNQPTQNSESQ